MSNTRPQRILRLISLRKAQFLMNFRNYSVRYVMNGDRLSDQSVLESKFRKHRHRRTNLMENVNKWRNR